MQQPDSFYQAHIFCCTNERPPGHPRGSCKGRGADPLRNYLKARVKEEGIPEARVNGAACMDRCELGPVLVIYPEGTWYTYKNEADVDEIVEKHLKNGEKVERLMLKKTDK